MSRVDRLAAEILQQAGILDAPVDVEQIARMVGAPVIFEPLEDEVSGMLYRRDNAATIAVNSRHARVRQRFTIAHEIGHHQLHKGREVIVDHMVRARVNFRDLTSSQATDREEIEANRFAAALLMPGDWVAELLGHTIPQARSTTRVVELLADRFEVSRQAMENRLINLGLRAAP